MRILYYHQHFSTPEGATGTRSYEMAQQLILHGHAVTMVCGTYQGGYTGLTGTFSNGKRQGIVKGIDVIELLLPYSNYDSFFKRSLTFLRFAIKSIWIALTMQYDLVLTTSTPLTAGIPGIVAKLLRRKPFIFEVRDLWPELPREMGVIRNPIILLLLDWLEWLSYHCADACIGLSPGIVQGIIRRRIASTHVTMIPNGCDLELFSVNTIPAPPRSSDDPSLVAVFTGAHGIANGLHAVLEAAHELLVRKRHDIRIVLIGEGKLKPQLQQRAQAEHIVNCQFLPPLPKTRMAELMRTVDVGLMILANVPAFYYGTSPNKFFDYLASGLPVLNNYPGWLSELITTHHCGIAVPPDNPAAFADALEYLADHPEERRHMGQNARQLAETMFDRKTLATQFVDWVEQCARNAE
jgi:glycosyltransferase involved in cell wall biosynthesis